MKFAGWGTLAFLFLVAVTLSPRIASRAFEAAKGALGLGLVFGVPYLAWIGIQWYLDKSRVPKDRYFAASSDASSVDRKDTS
jgi:hypothetical protein